MCNLSKNHITRTTQFRAATRNNNYSQPSDLNTSLDGCSVAIAEVSPNFLPRYTDKNSPITGATVPQNPKQPLGQCSEQGDWIKFIAALFGSE